MLEISSWSLSGERVTRRTRVDLNDVIQIPGSATAEVQLLKMLSLPNGQLILHIYDYQSNRLLLVGFTEQDLTTVNAPAITYGHTGTGGLNVDWANVPVTATAYNASNNQVVGTVPGSYGPNGSSVVVADAGTRQVKGFIPLANEASSIALSSNGQFAYVLEGTTVQQVNLNSFSVGWSWTSSDCGITSITTRPGMPQQVLALGGSSLHLIDNGVEVSSLVRKQYSLCASVDASFYGGTAYFTDSNRIIEFIPAVNTGDVSVYDASNNVLVAQAPAPIGFSGGSGGYVDLSLGFVYSSGGDIADATSLVMSTVAPQITLYTNGINLSVDYPDGMNMSCGCGLLTAFLPLSSVRFLAVRQQLPGVAIFDVMNGSTLSGRAILTDNMIGQSYLQPTRLDASTIAFGQSASFLGQGSLYFVQFPF